jgi:O-succinylbenzoate synthase
MEDPSGNDRSKHRRLWDELGTNSPLILEHAELWRVEIPFHAPVGTAVGSIRTRPLVLVCLHCRDATGGSPVEGWGECAALADTTFDLEDVAIAWTSLVQVLLPALSAAASEYAGALPPVRALRSIATLAPARPLAFAALEMAIGDAHLRASGRSFAELIGVAGAEVEPGAVLGVPESVDELLHGVESLRDQGYVRVKVKVSPGTELTTTHALAHWAETTPGPVPRFQVDANGAYGPDDMDLLAGLDRFGLLCIEQPFDRHDIESHRRLAARMITPICLDETLDGAKRVAESVTSGACSVVCVKQSRLGGIGVALEVIDWCTANGIPWWIGGMFESGFARRVTTALAALPGRSLPGDLAPPSTYLAGDLVDPMVGHQDPVSGRLALAVDGPAGMGPSPDRSLLERWVVRRIDIPLLAG